MMPIDLPHVGRLRWARLSIVATAALTFLLIPAFSEDPFRSDVRSWGDSVSWIVLWLITFRLLNRACRSFILDALSQQWLGSPMPRLFRDVFSAALFLVTLALIAQTAFDAALLPLYATSGVLTIIIGLALQSIILDFFVGFAIHVDRPFRLGDWLRIDDDTEAEVIALTWRTVQLRTASSESIYIPNGELGRAQFVNLSQESSPVRFSHNLILEYDVKPERGFRVLRAALSAVQGSDGILDDPAPAVVIRDTNQEGTHYLLRWWMHPYRPVAPAVARSRVITSAIDHLQSAGLAIALPVTVSPREMAHVPVVQSPSDRSAILRLNRLMAPLADDIVAALDPELTIRIVDAGTTVVNEGERPDRIFMVLEGLLTASTIHPAEGCDVIAHRLEPGSFFGEHMLEGGRPSPVRIVAASETVIVEIGLQRVAELMAAFPDLGREVRLVHRTRQRRIYDACRIEAILSAERSIEETALKSALRNLAGRARSIRPSKPRLLVVDDSRLQRHQLSTIAQSAGWTVCAEASDGLEAFDLYRDLRPDLVTMDLVMPRCDGLEALARIREFHPQARVVMVSAVDQPQKLERALELGAIDFVVKPYDSNTLANLFTRLRVDRSGASTAPQSAERPQSAPAALSSTTGLSP